VSDLYLLDASVIIDAHEAYYPIERIPEFWRWIADQAIKGAIKMPVEVFDEVESKDDLLTQWMKEHEEDLLLNTQDYQGRVDYVVRLYAQDLNEVELENLGKDPFLIAAALECSATVVTREGSKPSRMRANRHIPDVCKDAGVHCINDHQLIRLLDFRTSR
jgi:hypothetical protein